MFPLYFTKSFRFKKEMEMMQQILDTLKEINSKLDERPQIQTEREKPAQKPKFKKKKNRYDRETNHRIEKHYLNKYGD